MASILTCFLLAKVGLTFYLALVASVQVCACLNQLEVKKKVYIVVELP